MYSAPYGYGNAAGQPFNGAPQGQNPQMQPGPGPNQPQQQMMYNQQYPMGPGGAFPGAPNPGAMMPGGAGPAGMMQNTAMPQMPNGQSELVFTSCLSTYVSLPTTSSLALSPCILHLSCDSSLAPPTFSLPGSSFPVFHYAAQTIIVSLYRWCKKTSSLSGLDCCSRVTRV